ncbi:unnamed protein product [Ostreobium quekettii]|uniref:Uncharacterized protein n=1 Tax=Ostreobium quekettii TaxID=121088 RepID=A0A8S1IVY8_9CHLO|nr:unnamed protein product [Ostreobium quekettii]
MFQEKRGLKGLFQKKVDPKELVRKWQSSLRAEARKVDRQIRDIEREEKKAKQSVKDAAKRGDMASAKTLARALVNSKKTVSQLYTNKAHMVSMQAALTEQLAVARVSGTLSKSTEVMTAINKLVKIPELMNNLQEMSKEMLKTGLIEEIVEDTLESALDSEDLEEETEAEVDKILMEVTGETLAELPQAAKPQKVAAEPVEEEPEEEGAELGEMQDRLSALRN